MPIPHIAPRRASPPDPELHVVANELILMVRVAAREDTLHISPMTLDTDQFIRFAADRHAARIAGAGRH
jgi:hypothetical protein